MNAKKILILFWVLSLGLLILSGCNIYNLNFIILPDDEEFIACIEKLNTPEKIGNYMTENFTYEINSILLNPYQLFFIKKGDCDDFSFFATFIAHYYGYETYQILIEFPSKKYHKIGVFKEGDYYNISENTLYIESFCKNFKEIMNFYLYRNWLSYTVYNYWNEIVEQKNND